MQKIPLLAFFFLFLISFSPSLTAGATTNPVVTPLTVRAYTSFLQCTAATDRYGLYDEKMGDDLLSACIIRSGTPGSYTYESVPERLDDPVPYVSRLSAKRYCNWLQNGSPTGEQDETTTEEGAYMLDGTMEEDPAREESAVYFLLTSASNEIDPTLVSNLTTYMIVTHFADSFEFSSDSSSEDSAEAWTIGEVITGIVGIAAVTAAAFHHRGAALCGEQEYADLPLPSGQLTAQNRRNAAVAPHSLSPTNQRVNFSEVTLNYFTEREVEKVVEKVPITELKDGELLVRLSDRLSTLQTAETMRNCQGKFIKFHKQSDSPAFREARRNDLHKKIKLFLEEKIADCASIDSDKHAFLEKILSHFDFFKQKTTNLAPLEIARLRASNPSFFQNPNEPFWENLQERKKFFTYLDNMHKDPSLEDPEQMQKSVKDLISKRTILFEASEAIDAWKKEIEEAKDHLESLRQKFSTSAFTSLSNKIFDHCFDFGDYINFLIKSKTPMYKQTRWLTPESIAALRNDREAINQWLSDLKKMLPADPKETLPTDLEETLPADFEEKCLLLNKAIMMLSGLRTHNFNEALRFLQFKQEQEQEKRKQSSLTAAVDQEMSIHSPADSHNSSFTTQGHTDHENSPIPSSVATPQATSNFDKLLEAAEKATDPS